MIRLFFCCFLFFLSCSKSKISESDIPSIDSGKTLISLNQKSCVTGWGETLSSGEIRKAYKKLKTSTCTETCESISTELICKDGILLNAETFLYNSCEKPKCDCKIDFLSKPVTLKHGDFIKLFSKNSLNCEPCSTYEVERQCIDGQLLGDTKAKFQNCNSTPCEDCMIAPNTILEHNKSQDFFKSRTGLNCDPNLVCDAISNKQTRKCLNGSLTGDSSFNEISCSNSNCSCQIGTSTFLHDQSLQYYKSSKAKCTDTFKCEDAINKVSTTCQNGVIVGLGSTQAFDKCQQESCSCEFIDNKGVKSIIADGNSIQVFTNSQEACGKTCDAGSITCNKGVLSGATTKKSRTCSVNSCTCTAPWGTIYPSTLTKTNRISFFKQATSICGEAKCNELVGNKIDLFCINNNNSPHWVDESDRVISDFSQYRNQSCNDPACNCIYKGKTILQGQVGYFYKESSVPCKEVCEKPENSIGVKCLSNLSVESVPSSANLNSFFTQNPNPFLSCQTSACPPGDPTEGSPIQDGGGSGDGQQGDGGGTGGGTGDGAGPGIGFKGREAPSGSPVSPGGRHEVVITLNTITKTGNSNGCTLPWGGIVTHGASVISYSVAQAPAGKKCSEFKKLRMCLAGILSGDPVYSNLDCREAQ